MNVQISYKGLEKIPGVESTVQQHLQKLERRLQLFRPELVSLHGSVLQKSTRAGYVVALNLKMPTGDLATEQASQQPATAIKAAFDSLINQVTSHKDVLRNHHGFPGRRRGSLRRPDGTVPFEQTFAAVKLDGVSNEDVDSYINANLPRLRRFVERELRSREDDERIVRGALSADEVIGEAIGNALSDSYERPQKIGLEAWLYRLSVEAVDRLTGGDSGGGNVPLESSARLRNEDGSDESVLQFHQPDDDLSARSIDMDDQIANPEQLAAKDEMITLVERTLRDAGHHEREAFILYTIEGFTIQEITDITQRPEEEVRRNVHTAREHLKKALPVRDPLSDRLIEQARTA
jgi:RNA polymerase sigma factor (sigma-70 family)